MLAAQALCSLSSMKAPPTKVSFAYGVFGVCVLSVYHFVANGEFSALLTMAVMFQCLSVALLCLQTAGAGAAGLSARALGLEAASLGLRLSSTTWLNGYLPVDASGDMVYQLVDICSLAMVLWLMYQVTVVHRASYQADADSLPIVHMLLGSFLLAAIFHADMNSRPLFDTLWMAGLFVGVVSVLPQLWLVSKTGGVIQACTSHWIAMMAVSRVMSGIFMWHARFDVTCAPWVDGVSHAIWAILAAHVIHLVLLGDFAYFYLKAIATQGLACSLDLRAELDIV